jgi:hypothetical protein
VDETQHGESSSSSNGASDLFDRSLILRVHAGTSRDIRVRWNTPPSPLSHERLFLGLICVEDPKSRQHIPTMCSLNVVSSMSVQEYIHLGDSTIGSTRNFTLPVRNTSSTDLHYIVVLVSKSAPTNLRIKGQQTGVVAPTEEKHILLEFTGTSSGRWTHELLVRNLNNRFDQKTVTIGANVTPQKSLFVHFPDLDPQATGKLQPLMLGNIYMPHPSASSHSQVLACTQSAHCDK